MKFSCKPILALSLLFTTFAGSPTLLGASVIIGTNAIATAMAAAEAAGKKTHTKNNRMKSSRSINKTTQRSRSRGNVQQPVNRSNNTRRDSGLISAGTRGGGSPRPPGGCGRVSDNRFGNFGCR